MEGKEERKYDLKLLDDRVRIPVMASAGAAAYDLQAARIINEDKTIMPLTAPMKIEPGETVKVGTGVAIHIKDRDVAGFIIPRSGKGSQGLVVGNLVGLIDSDYQGELIVSLWNRNPESSGKTLWVDPLERVAQIFFTSIIVVNFTGLSTREAPSFRAGRNAESQDALGFSAICKIWLKVSECYR